MSTFICGTGLRPTFFGLFVFMGLLGHGSLAFGQQKHPAEERGTARSIKSEVQTSIEFVNLSNQTIKLHWLNFEGKREFIRNLMPDERHTEKTFLNYPWLLTDPQDNALALYYPDAEKRVINFGQGTTRPKLASRDRAPAVQNPRLLYLQDSEGQKDLKLSKEQREKFEALAAKQKNAGFAGFLKAQRAAEMNDEIEKAVATMLDADQKKRLEQLIRQDSGRRLLADKTLLAGLKLSEDQQAKFKEIETRYSGQISAAINASRTGDLAESKRKIADSRKTTFNDVTAMLTAEQKNAWRELVGEPWSGFVGNIFSAGTAAPGFGNPVGFGEPGGITGPISRRLPFNVGSSITTNMKYLREESVQTALKLTPEQIKATGLNVKAMSTTLTPAQLNAYNGIHLQIVMRTAGPAGIYRYRLINENLKLSNDQITKILEIGQEDARGFAALNPKTDESVQTLNKNTQAKLDKVLNADQQARVKELLGEPFKGAVKNTNGFASGPGGAPGGWGNFANSGLGKKALDGQSSGLITYLQHKGIQSELKLQKEQIEKLAELAKEQAEVISRLGELPAFQGLTQVTALRQDYDKKVTGLLDVSQAKRFAQIQRQDLGRRLFTETTLIGALKLSPDQSAKLKELESKFTTQTLDASKLASVESPEFVKHLHGLRKSTFDAVLSLLDADQRATWNDLVGEPWQGYLPASALISPRSTSSAGNRGSAKGKTTPKNEPANP